MRKLTIDVAAEKRAGINSQFIAMIKYSTVFLQSRAERFELIEFGVPEEVLINVAQDMGREKDEISKLLQVPITSRNRKNSARRKLYRDEAGRVLGLLRLIGQVEVMVKQSGVFGDFDAAKWVAVWIETPVPALGGRRPADYLHLQEGQELLSALLAQTQSGAYA